MTAPKSFAELAKKAVDDRRRRLLRKLRARTTPLSMFEIRGGGYCTKDDLERNIRMGNALHLEDLMNERNE